MGTYKLLSHKYNEICKLFAKFANVLALSNIISWMGLQLQNIFNSIHSRYKENKKEICHAVSKQFISKAKK